MPFTDDCRSKSFRDDPDYKRAEAQKVVLRDRDQREAWIAAGIIRPAGKELTEQAPATDTPVLKIGKILPSIAAWSRKLEREAR